MNTARKFPEFQTARRNSVRTNTIRNWIIQSGCRNLMHYDYGIRIYWLVKCSVEHWNNAFERWKQVYWYLLRRNVEIRSDCFFSIGKLGQTLPLYSEHPNRQHSRYWLECTNLEFWKSYLPPAKKKQTFILDEHDGFLQHFWAWFWNEFVCLIGQIINSLCRQLPKYFLLQHRSLLTYIRHEISVDQILWETVDFVSDK